MTEALYFLRDTHLLDGDHRGWNRAEHRTGSLAVVKSVPTEPCNTRDLVGEVGVVELLELDAILLEHDCIQHLADLIRAQDGLARNRIYLAACAQHRRRAGAKVQVRRLVANEGAQQVLDPVQRAVASGGDTRRL